MFDKFDTMFSNAKEFTPNPEDFISDEFDSLDEVDAGGEEDLEEIDCSGMTAEDDPCAVEGGTDDGCDLEFDLLTADDFNFDALPKYGSEANVANAQQQLGSLPAVSVGPASGGAHLSSNESTVLLNIEQNEF